MIEAQIKIDKSKVSKDIVNEIRRILNKNIYQIQTVLNKAIENIVFNRLTSGVPIISGQDLYEIGVPDINNRIMSVIRVASQSIEVKVSPGNLLKIDIGILKQDYSDLLSLPESVYRYTSAHGSGILEWLKWLLIEGNGPIIGGFHFEPIIDRDTRTGVGYMVIGGNWQMPPHLAGTAQNNILTRALSNIEKDIEIIVQKEMQRAIR